MVTPRRAREDPRGGDAAYPPDSASMFQQTMIWVGAALRGTKEQFSASYRQMSGWLFRTDAFESSGGSDYRGGVISGAARPRSRQGARSPAPPRHNARAAKRQRRLDAAAGFSDGPSKLSQAMTDANPRVRKLALDTIGEFSEERASRLISELLHDFDSTVRCAAAAAAGRANAAGAVFSLIFALDDSQPEVREQAKAAIEKITQQKIELGEADRLQNVEELQRWWKERRLAHLTSDAEKISPR